MVQVLRDFESKIIDRFKTFSVIEGGGKARLRKGVWIRKIVDYLGDNPLSKFMVYLEKAVHLPEEM